MSDAASRDPISDANAALAILAVDPSLGCVLRAWPGPFRDRWLGLLASAFPPGAVRRVPATVGELRLLGGLDLAATLKAGRPVAERGLLAEADGGVLVIASAERMPPTIAAQLSTVLDTGVRVLERDGFADVAPARIGVVALDESEGDEAMPAPLAERLALRVWMVGMPLREAERLTLDMAAVAQARARFAGVRVPEPILSALAEAAAALGIASLRPPVAAVRAARAAAALAGRDAAVAEDAAIAARLVLAPVATVLPAPPEAEESPPPPEEQTDTPPERESNKLDEAEIVLAAAAAAIPPGLLAALAAGTTMRMRSEGRSGAKKFGNRRGRPAGVLAGDPVRGARLSVIDTLRAAAPWQRLRVRTTPSGGRVQVRRDDFRIRRFAERTRSLTIFAVDASGSTALARLAETKGAVELLLAESYVRRDQVALIAFRGTEASVLLPPTGALARARRALAQLPGGGATPLAAAIDAAALLADASLKRGLAPSVVLLTDGKANVARDGSMDRAKAEADALAAAQAARGLRVVLIDTSPRPQPSARRLAEAMAATYLPLPAADAAALSRAVKAAK